MLAPIASVSEAGLGRANVRVAPTRRGLLAKRMTGATVGAAVLFLAATGFGSDLRTVQTPTLEVDRLASRFGLAIDPISVSGHRITTDQAIFDAIGRDPALSMLGFDVAAAQARIEALPWVAKATITRRPPEGLSVTISERTPAAIWTDAGRTLLVDIDGRSLAAIDASSRPDLLRIEGADAARHIAELEAELAAFQAIRRRVTQATYVAQRRWSLQLDGRLAVELPDVNIAHALSAFAAMHDRGLDERIDRIDLRSTSRVAISIRSIDPVTSHALSSVVQSVLP